MEIEGRELIYDVFTDLFRWMDASDIEQMHDLLEDEVISDIEELPIPKIGISVMSVLLSDVHCSTS